MKIVEYSPYIWRIPKEGEMLVDGIVFASKEMIEDIKNDHSLQQVANVATLPGIQKAAFGMPDIHWGYGFPIGGVAAMELKTGVISPGGVGYDINCGVRLLKTQFSLSEIENKLEELVTLLFKNIPTGIGKKKSDIKISTKSLNKLLKEGMKWTLDEGFAREEDLEYIEDNGTIEGADPNTVSQRAKERGVFQLGSLGSGNHFLEIQVVNEIYRKKEAQTLGIDKGQIVIMIHCGSRGLGHQVCSDYVKIMVKAMNKYGIKVPDKQLCCSPINSVEGQSYLKAMAAAANFAFVNRQVITYKVRKVFASVLGFHHKKIPIHTVYDVCHNIAKIETFKIDNKTKKLLVHRKGATRAFPPQNPFVPSKYRSIGQPVLIPGDMGRYSFILVGTQKAYQYTFGSTCHGAGRVLSRRKAKQQAKGRDLLKEMKDKGVIVKAAGMATVAEEMPIAYKDAEEVVNIVENVGISMKVAKLKPVAVIKG